MKQKLGTVYTITSGRLITVRLGNIRKPPKLGLKIYGKQETKPIGRIIDVVGPVETPFAVIKLEAEAQVSIGDPLYIEPPKSRWKPGQKREKRRGFQKRRSFMRRNSMKKKK